MRIPEWPGDSDLQYHITQNLFLRLLGIIFLFAFWSLNGQILGLAGSDGIIPAARALEVIRAQIGFASGLRNVPTLFWFNASDAALLNVCRAGIIASVGLTLSWRLTQLVQKAFLLICFLLYLSLVSIGAPFTSFQWDALLLETAFLGLFAGSRLSVWVFRLLLFRLMFESGVVKLQSGDPNWRNLHALRFHFVTQPLPMPLAWYVGNAPAKLLDAMTFLTFVIELAVPFLLFGPRAIRRIGGLLLIALQISILLTGKYCFFNWLTLALCVWAFDDSAFKTLGLFAPWNQSDEKRSWKARTALAPVACLFVLGVAQVFALFVPRVNTPFAPVLELIGPWQILNSYGLFAVMTTTRPEINFEASEDGENWREYIFPYKPVDVKRSLPVVAPFQPRLDWQMWFAALSGSYQADRWTVNLAARLLEGSPQVASLLPSPFPHKPRYVRARLYLYWFTTPQQRRETGAVWTRTFRREYLPPISLDQIRQPGQ